MDSNVLTDVVSEVVPSLDAEILYKLQDIETLVAQNVELQLAVYTLLLVITGCVSAVGVCVLLYKFLKSFY